MRDRLELAGILLVRGLARALPAGAATALGRGLGGVFHVLGLRRAVVLENLRRAFGSEMHDERIASLARRVYENVGVTLVEFLRLTPRTAAAHAETLNLDGEEHLHEALRAGRGAIVATAHLGNWEVLAAAAVARGLPVTLVVQRLQNRQADALLWQMRERTGLRLLERGMALRRIRRELQANRLVCIMCDQDARRRGIFVPFFGTPASTHKGAAQLALRWQVPFIPLFGRRQSGGIHGGRVHAPLETAPDVDEKLAVRALLERYTTLLEGAIREHPDQYLWTHRRWKSRPPADHPDQPVETDAADDARASARLRR